MQAGRIRGSWPRSLSKRGAACVCTNYARQLKATAAAIPGDRFLADCAEEVREQIGVHEPSDPRFDGLLGRKSLRPALGAVLVSAWPACGGSGRLLPRRNSSRTPVDPA